MIAMEADIADAISRGLRLKLPPADETPLTEHRVDSEAHRLYLRSRYEMSKPPSANGLKIAITYAEQAIGRDPLYAPAHVALAQAYSTLGGGGVLTNKEANTRAKASAMKALEIDESLPEAHTVLGHVGWYLDWDWGAAEREFKRALELNPNSADAHGGYAGYLVAMGRFEEGMASAKRAAELDPLTPMRHIAVGFVYLLARQYDRALAASKEAREFVPDLGHFVFGFIYRRRACMRKP